MVRILANPVQPTIRPSWAQIVLNRFNIFEPRRVPLESCSAFACEPPATSSNRFLMSPTRSSIIPLFPLPDAILFPGQILPLHVFEQRYREMTHDLLDGRGELAIGTVLGNDRKLLEKVAPCQSIAGVGRVEKYQELADGRFLIVLVGQSRARLNPVSAADTSYPLAEVELFPEDHQYEHELFRESILGLLSERDVTPEDLKQASLAQICDVLLMTLKVEPEVRYELFAEPELPKRIERALELA